MINLAQTGIHANLVSESNANYHYRQRMKLAFAVFDVEVANTHLAELDPMDRQYDQRLEQLNVALASYWRIDKQVDEYMRKVRGN